MKTTLGRKIEMFELTSCDGKTGLFVSSDKKREASPLSPGVSKKGKRPLYPTLKKGSVPFIPPLSHFGLSKPQRAAQQGMGSDYMVDKFTYGFFNKVGSIISSLLGGGAGAAMDGANN
jgi:hypothetical protein